MSATEQTHATAHNEHAKGETSLFARFWRRRPGAGRIAQDRPHPIVVRPFTFDFPADLNPVWSPKRPVLSHMFNGFSLTMPYLEPYLIRTMREVTPQISEPGLLKDIRGFNGQEGRHFECHRRMNELLKSNGYPELAQVENRLAASYARLGKRSLRTRLAYNAGFESMTNGFTNWFISKRRDLFGNACPYVASFWIMHMIEEGEHKTVAFDAYKAYSGAYLPRVLGVLHGSFHVLGYGMVGMVCALRKDGTLYRPGTLLAILRETSSLVWNVGPYLLRALVPGYDPRQEEDPQWMRDWVAGYARLPAGAPLPLVDTANEDIPVPFPAAG